MTEYMCAIIGSRERGDEYKEELTNWKRSLPETINEIVEVERMTPPRYKFYKWDSLTFYRSEDKISEEIVANYPFEKIVKGENLEVDVKLVFQTDLTTEEWFGDESILGYEQTLFQVNFQDIDKTFEELKQENPYVLINNFLQRERRKEDLEFVKKFFIKGEGWLRKSYSLMPTNIIACTQFLHYDLPITKTLAFGLTGSYNQKSNLVIPEVRLLSPPTHGVSLVEPTISGALSEGEQGGLSEIVKK